MNDHERGFLEFLAEPSRRRVEMLLRRGEKRRADIRSLLDHSIRLDPAASHHLQGSSASAPAIMAALRERGAPERSYVLSASSKLDDKEMSLEEALANVVGGGSGSFVSCLPGTLGFYEFEDAKSSYLLVRNA